jgi:hypothetical protein
LPPRYAWRVYLAGFFCIFRALVRVSSPCCRSCRLCEVNMGLICCPPSTLVRFLPLCSFCAVLIACRLFCCSFHFSVALLLWSFSGSCATFGLLRFLRCFCLSLRVPLWWFSAPHFASGRLRFLVGFCLSVPALFSVFCVPCIAFGRLRFAHCFCPTVRVLLSSFAVYVLSAVFPVSRGGYALRCVPAVLFCVLFWLCTSVLYCRRARLFRKVEKLLFFAWKRETSRFSVTKMGKMAKKPFFKKR